MCFAASYSHVANKNIEPCINSIVSNSDMALGECIQSEGSLLQKHGSKQTNGKQGG